MISRRGFVVAALMAGSAFGDGARGADTTTVTKPTSR